MPSAHWRDSLWMPFTPHADMAEYPPLVIRKASGIYLFDDAGNCYVDAIGSWWVSLFGHCHPDISDAIRTQLDNVEHVMMAGCIAEPTIKLVGKLSALLPAGLDKIFFSDNGSTAVEVALKMALQYHLQTGHPERKEFIALGGGYHGDTLGAMTVGSIPQYHSMFHDCFKKALFTDTPYCYRCPCGKEKSTCAAECMDSLETLLLQAGESVAAVIFEPMVQGAAGMRIYPDKVLRRIFSLCKEHSILTIADEVAMGFGRTGKMFACEHAGAVPHIMCLAKGLTGGYLPLSVTVTGNSIFEAFSGDAFSGKTFEHGHTFTGNPLASAAACAALDLLDTCNIPASQQHKSDKLAALLDEFYQYDITGDVRTLGGVGAIEVVADKATKKLLPASHRIPFHICRNALKHGLLLRPLGNVIYFMLPYITTEAELDTIIKSTHTAFRETIDERLTRP